MLKENSSLLNLKLIKEKSLLTKVGKQFIEALYELFEQLLIDPIENLYFEIISLFIGYLQIIIFIFNETFLPIWNKDSIIKEIFNIFQILHFTVILKINVYFYTIIVFAIILLIFFTSFLMIIMIYRIKYNQKLILWPINILKYILPILSFGFFGQILLIFTTIFYCRKTESITSPYLKCNSKHWFNRIKPIGAIAMILHFIIAFITNTLYYKLIFIHSDSDLLKKSNSFPDVIFLFIKTIIIVLFILDKGVESEHWFILSFLILVTGINVYFTIFYNNRQNKILGSLEIFFCLVLFSGFLILFIGKIIKFLKFNGGIFLFYCCVIIIIMYIIFFKTDEIDYISKDYKKINNPDEYLQYITYFYNFIKNKNNSRNYAIIIKSLITSLEEKCVEQNCLLKKYLKNLKNGYDFEYILFQFCEKLFQHGISKFNENISIKNHYCLFLIFEMDNKKKALMILEEIKNEMISLEQNYNIYRSQKIIDNYSSSYVHRNNFNFEYRKNVQGFRIYIENVISLYYDFFSLLLESKIQNINNFEKINKIGYEIRNLNKKIEKTFDYLINIKTNNCEIINLYSEFVENLLNDEKKIKKCRNLKTIIYDNHLTEIHEKDYSSYNLEILKENFDLKYLIISTESKNLGIILDCPNNLSKILGYQANELIGNSIDILIPEIYRKKHAVILRQKTDENKLNFMQGYYKNSIYSPKFIQKDTFCISKSKLLLSLNLKIYLVNTEENELVYIAEIEKNNYINYDLLKTKNEDPLKYCVLTDKNFVIQSFTPNCINYLNMNYDDINSNFSIMNYIKQFKEDYSAAVKKTIISRYIQIKNTGMLSMRNSRISNKNTKKNNISFRRKQKIKRDLFNKKYLKKCRITWTSYVENNKNIEKNEQKKFWLRHNLIDNIDTNIIFEDNIFSKYSEIDLYMEAKKVILDNESIGYKFFFSKYLKPKKHKSILSCKIMHQKSSNKKLEIKKLKKYQIIIKPPNFLLKNTKNFTGIIKLDPNSISFKDKFINKKSEILNNIEKMNLKVKFKDDEYDENNKRGSQYSSSQTIYEINKDEDIIINEDFIPKDEGNFIFNINKISYDYSPEIKDNDIILNEILKKEATDKLNKMNKIKPIKLKTKISSSSDFSSSNKSDSSYEIQDFSYPTPFSHPDSSSNSNSLNEITSRIRKNKGKSKYISNIINEKDESLYKKRNSIINENITETNMKKIKNKLLKSYYCVNLKNIIKMVYDFNKDCIIEDKTKNNTSKIEKILNNYQREHTIKRGKDENYPFVSFIFKSKKDEKEKAGKKEKNEKNEKNKEDKQIKNNGGSKKNKNSYKISYNDKVIETKITEAINNHKDEIPIKKLKILAKISFIILIIIGLLNFIYNIYFYSLIKELFLLIKNSLYMKKANLICIYYIRELTLLNIEVNGIEGGNYTDFPDISKDHYISLIQEKLIELFQESQSSMKKIFSTTLSFSKNNSKYISDNQFNIGILAFNYSVEYIYSNIYTTLIQFNNALYNLVFINNIFLVQNNSDIYDYIHNSFNNYGKILDLLINIFNSELENQNKILKIIIIIVLIIIFFIFATIYIIGIKYFILSNYKRINYIEVFYSINEHIIKIEMLKCRKLKNKFKSFKDEEKEDNDIDEENSIDEQIKYYNNCIKNKNNEDKQNDYIEENKNNKSLSFINRLFIIFEGLFVLIIFGYFIFIYNYLFRILQKTINISYFLNEILKYQFNIFDLYNVYREYLFDNQSIISNMPSYEYLIKKEKEVFETITENKKNINKTLIHIINTNEEIKNSFYSHYCSFNETEYFSTFDKCKNKFGNIVDLDFYSFIDFFLEKIRIKKNIAKYILENEIVFGNLTKYNTENNTENFHYLLNNNNHKKIIFRLNLFNYENLHSDINLLFFNIILPLIKSTLQLITNSTKIEGEYLYFILIIILYIFAISIIFFACLFPLINFLNKQIYKTKNMLSIIPINFLLYNSNIKSLINLLVDD